jgi:hypothetical protein
VLGRSATITKYSSQRKLDCEMCHSGNSGDNIKIFLCRESTPEFWVFQTVTCSLYRLS